MKTSLCNILLGCIVFVLGGCASLLNDSNQTITIRTDCQRVVLHRTCTASVNAQIIHFETPARLTIPRSAESISIYCQGGLLHGAGKEVVPGVASELIGNVVAGGAVGVILDLKTQRAFSYPSVTNITMPICRYL